MQMLTRTSRSPGPGSPSAPRSPQVALVCMPWVTTVRPSIALGILARMCQQRQITVRTIYPNLDFAALLGKDLFESLCTNRLLFGLAEHLFACDIFGADRLASAEFLRRFVESRPPAPLSDPGYLLHLRDELAGSFLDSVQQRILGLKPAVVGFTATYNQVMASLAMGRRLKRAQPSLRVLLGGACLDGEMGPEYHRALTDAVDHVFVGEADESFREYLDRLQDNRPATEIPGVTWNDGGSIRFRPPRALANMNKAAVPDYGDFFDEADRVRRASGVAFTVTDLPFESSRGCWWGQKSQCVFCGINNEIMAFREKSADRVVEEIVYLSRQYQVMRFAASDWIISKRSRRTIFERLSKLGYDLECFYETRADMAKDEIAVMRDAGITSVQPGIESFSTELLELMRKHTSRIRHVQFLRWCLEYGINVFYNILAGFPGERSEWYLAMADFIPKLIHLQPPSSNVFFLEMDRFSPLFERRDQFGVVDYEIRWDYAYNFPPETVDLLKIGYFFDYRCDRLASPTEYLPALRPAVEAWIKAHDSRPPAYTYKIGPDFVVVTDCRSSRQRIIQLAGVHRDTFLLCDRIQTCDSLRRLLAGKWPMLRQDKILKEVVGSLVQRDLLMREGSQLLALPVGLRARTTSELYRHVLGDDPGPQVDPDDDRRTEMRTHNVRKGP